MADQIFIQRRFTIKQGDQVLQDAIVLPKEDYDKLTPEEIETTKQQRFNNWQDAINNPPAQPVLSKAEQIAQVNEQLASLDEQKATLTAQKSSIQVSLGLPVEDPVAVKPV